MQDRDPLTGLPADEACLAEMSRMIASGEAFTLLLVDLYELKYIVNGSHSARGGDWLLQRVGQTIGALDPLATVFRFGGDEFVFGGDAFVVLLPTCDIREATQLGQRIRAAVSSIDILESGEPVEPDDPAPWRLDCRIGIARWPGDAETAGDLVAVAVMSILMARRDGQFGGFVATTTGVPRDLPGSAGSDGA